MSVLLKKSNFEDISPKELAEQIESKKKCQKKLPTWFSTPKIYYPKKLNIEQTSSEITARYKSNIVTGKSLVDITGGLGIDSFFFAKKVKTVSHCEINPELHEISTHNFKILGANNIKSYAEDGLTFLKNTNTKFDWIYIDPSRRNDKKGKVFLLSDCTPDVTANFDFFFSKTEHILIKTSPLLDISLGLKSIPAVKEVHIVAVGNDVKELLWVLEKNQNTEAIIKTINITPDIEHKFEFKISEEKEISSTKSDPLEYLYEPNSAILKSGAFKTIGQHYKLSKLNENTHLYTSNECIDFPGRRFKVTQTYPYKLSLIKKLGIRQANITCRNFPESVAMIRKKTGIKDGGDVFLFFFKNLEGKHQVLHTTKI